MKDGGQGCRLSVGARQLSLCILSLLWLSQVEDQFAALRQFLVRHAVSSERFAAQRHALYAPSLLVCSVGLYDEIAVGVIALVKMQGDTVEDGSGKRIVRRTGQSG